MIRSLWEVWNDTKRLTDLSIDLNSCQRLNAKIRSIKFSRMAGSWSLPCPLRGERGKLSHGKAWVKKPEPVAFRHGFFGVNFLPPACPSWGDLLLNTKPQRSALSSSVAFFFAERSHCALIIGSTLVRMVMEVEHLGSPTRCMASRGTDRPHSTSGQTVPSQRSAEGIGEKVVELMAAVIADRIAKEAGTDAEFDFFAIHVLERC